MNNNSNVTDYERTLDFNPMTRWLHGFRYRHADSAIASLASNGPLRIVDIGCAHAQLFERASSIQPIDYTGIEVRDEFVIAARARYGAHPNFRILHEDAVTALARVHADLVVALETLEHIPEHDVVRIIEQVAAMRPKRFIASVPVEVGPSIWAKNVGSFLSGYVRHHEYSWRETWWAGLGALDRLPPHGTGHKGFDWRWLAQTIRHNMQIVNLKRTPVPWLPASVFIVAVPR